MNATLIGFIVYLLVVLTVGLFAYQRTQSQHGFILADRKLGSWVIAFSERASGESAWLLVGLPGAAFAMGFLELWTVIGCTTGILISWSFIARRLREEVGRSDSLTLGDFFQHRFPQRFPYIRLAASLIITFFYTFYVAAQFNGAGKVLDTTFGELLAGIQSALGSIGLDVTTITIGMCIGAIIVLFYTTLGGFLAVAWTDFVQGIIMIFTCVLLPIVGWFAFGGAEALLPTLKENTDLLSLTGGETGWGAAFGVIGGLSWGLGYMGQPHLLMRYMAIRSPKDVRKSTLIAAFWAVPAFWGAFLIGVIGVAHYGPGAFEDPERLMPAMAQTLLPAWIAGIMISGAIAAMMSTADSQLLVTTSTVSEDIYHKLLGRKGTEEQLAVISRTASLVIGIIAFLLAIRSSEGVFAMVSYAWSGLGAAFGPQLLFTLWWKRTTANAILASMILGPLSVILWKVFELDAHLTERVIGFAIATVLIVVISLLETAKSVPTPESARNRARTPR